jgi:hypothetical protein
MRKTSTEYSREYRARQKARGQCIDCSAPNDGVHVRCAHHHASMKRVAAALRKPSQAAGINRRCWSCGAEINWSRCDFCGLDATARREEWEPCGVDVDVVTTARLKG